jgi:hypothetical protein
MTDAERQAKRHAKAEQDCTGRGAAASTTWLHSASTFQHHADRLGLSCAILALLFGVPVQHGDSIRALKAAERDR